MALVTNVFERLGLDADQAAAAFHAYASFTIGSTLFAASRRITTEVAEAEGPSAAPAERFGSDGSTRAEVGSADGIGRAIEGMVDLSSTDPQRDEELFVQGLRRLIASFASPRSG